MTQTAILTSDPQRDAALKRANEVRLARAALKRRIALGDMSAAEVILGLPDEVMSWPVCELLRSQRRWGNQRCVKFLKRNEIPERKHIGTLTLRQRELLATQLSASPTLEVVKAY
jgi:hypothetical protein